MENKEFYNVSIVITTNIGPFVEFFFFWRKVSSGVKVKLINPPRWGGRWVFYLFGYFVG